MKNQTTPLVSIVMSVYNGGRFLRQQMDSILAQTYSHFELICVDDQSTDDSYQILKEYQAQDNRIKVFQNEQNLGYNKNFERGITLTSGDFISISDQDDIWLPSKIADLVQNIGDEMVIYSDSEMIDEQNNKLELTLGSSLYHINQPSFKNFLENNFITGHTMLFKRELKQHILPFPDLIHFYDWWIGFAASYVGKIKFLNKVLTQYRVHSNSVIQVTKRTLRTRTEKTARSLMQNQAFAEATFLKSADRKFILHYLALKKTASGNFINYLKCFVFLAKHNKELYPWYKKGKLSKFNYLRKQCA